jgi:hypothetical protein
MSEDIGDRGEEQQFQICPSLAGIRSARLGRRPPMMFLSGPPIGPCAVKCKNLSNFFAPAPGMKKNPA